MAKGLEFSEENRWSKALYPQVFTKLVSSEAELEEAGQMIEYSTIQVAEILQGWNHIMPLKIWKS